MIASEKRTGTPGSTPDHLGDLLAALDEATGKEPGYWAGQVAELTERQARLRVMAIRTGQLSASRYYTREQLDHWFRVAGLDEQDWEMVWVRVEDLPPAEMSDEMTRAANGRRASEDVPLLRVRRYRLRPDRWGPIR